MQNVLPHHDRGIVTCQIMAGQTRRAGLRHLERMPVILSAAKSLARWTKRSFPFATLRASAHALRMTGRTPLKSSHGKPNLQMSKQASRNTFLEQNCGRLWRDAPVHYAAHCTFITPPHYTNGREDEVQRNRSRKERGGTPNGRCFGLDASTLDPDRIGKPQ